MYFTVQTDFVARSYFWFCANDSSVEVGPPLV